MRLVSQLCHSWEYYTCNWARLAGCECTDAAIMEVNRARQCMSIPCRGYVTALILAGSNKEANVGCC